MRIARRTGGGRGVYEVAGEHDTYAPASLYERQMRLVFPPSIVLSTGIVLREQGGKPRLVIGVNGAVHIQRQLATILLLPSPTRTDNNFSSGTPILRTERYAIETVEFESLSVSDD